MRTYIILKDNFPIGQAKGLSNAFKYIQKHVVWEGIKGYWKGDSYIHNEQVLYSIERTSNE